MRNFTDIHGQEWHADVLDASYGTMLVLFWRLGSFEVFKSPLRAGNHLSAENEVAAFSNEELCERLAQAEPWSQEAGK
ncbi:MAG: hypothetical protein ACRETQ_05000 [Gammaproteobacteria bacterium]